MPKADFIAKLRQIEEQANAVIAELPPGADAARACSTSWCSRRPCAGGWSSARVAVVRIDPRRPSPDEPAPA